MGNPELVVLDEPTTGLDVESRRRLWSAVRGLGAGRSILFTTHYLEEAQELATRIIVIDRGRTLFDGVPQSLRERVGGRRLTYVGSDGPVAVTTNDADQYVRAMVAGGVAFSELEIVRPSLEEAFLSLDWRQSMNSLALVRAHARIGYLDLARWPGYVVPTIVFPAMFFALFDLPFARRSAGLANFTTLAFVVFSIVGVTLYQFGVGIAQERGRPWERYLRTLAGLGRRAFRRADSHCGSLRHADGARRRHRVAGLYADRSECRAMAARRSLCVPRRRAVRSDRHLDRVLDVGAGRRPNRDRSEFAPRLRRADSGCRPKSSPLSSNEFRCICRPGSSAISFGASSATATRCARSPVWGFIPRSLPLSRRSAIGETSGSVMRRAPPSASP